MIEVCIVGVGLIGGSLGKALRRVRSGGKRRYRVIGLGRSAGKLRRAKKLGAVDEASSHPSILRTADIVVLCVPVQGISGVAKKIRPFLKKGAVVTDVGSVKGKVLSAMRGFNFVGAHPIAGSEKTGVGNARADLFKGATCVLVRGKTSKKDFLRVQGLWRAAGARCLSLSASDHDKFLALTSHLPHLISFAYFSLVYKAVLKKPLIRSLVAGSFRDMTRIAGADPDLWSGVVDLNRTELRRVQSDFARSMNAFIRASNEDLRRSIQALSAAKRSWK